MSKSQATPTNPAPKTVSPWVKGFVVWHILCTVIWTVPNARPQLLKGEVSAKGSDHLVVFFSRNLKTLPPVRAYLLSTGTWQYWDMFAPDPVQTDYWGDAEVVYLDGSTKIFQYPRVFLESLPKKYVTERFRKLYERAHLEDNAYIWPDFAQRIALLSAEDVKNPPIKVRLRRHFQLLIRPGQKEQSPYRTYQYYTHMVDQPGLARAKAWPTFKPKGAK